MEKKIELPEKYMNYLLDNCNASEVHKCMEFIDLIIPKTIKWYCESKKHKKCVEYTLQNKFYLSINYEFYANEDK